MNPTKGLLLLYIDCHTGEEIESWKGYVIFPEAQSSEMEPWFPVGSVTQGPTFEDSDYTASGRDQGFYEHRSLLVRVGLHDSSFVIIS